MACGSCGTTENGVPRGCKSNGNCGTGTCGSGSEKLAVFDWLSNMTLPSGQERFTIFEVRFKNGRKHFYKNVDNLPLIMGDIIAVEGSPGHDIGTISLAGELVKVQMKKHKITADSEEVKKIYRKATQKDIDIWQKARAREEETQRKGREILGKLGLKMKLSDVEFQGDGNKATFYYTADARVDFRQLIRDLASAFSIRVEMKQVGARQEAARLGGVGSCGRELCCSTWLTDFRKVTTSAARYQQLSLNPLKLAGQCGKLKCCLNFELDTYLDALKSFPKQDVVLRTEKGDAVFIKMDIFKKHLWYTYKEERFKWFRLTLEQVQEIIDLNKNNEKSMSLEEYESDVEIPVKVDFEDAVGQDSLTRFDVPKPAKEEEITEITKERNQLHLLQRNLNNLRKSNSKKENQNQILKQNQRLKINRVLHQAKNRILDETAQILKAMHRIIEINLLKNKKVVFLVMLLGIIACSDGIEFIKYKSLPNASWEANENVSFEFQISDTISPKNLFINIRNTKDYAFSNLYVITALDFPNGARIIDTLQYEMADKSGRYLGKGFTEIKENKLFYKEKKVFPESGKYMFSVHHAMRKNGQVNPIASLEGIQDIGFSIESLN